MKRPLLSSTAFSSRGMFLVGMLTLAAFAAADRGWADDEFQKLVNQIPRSANAIVLLNMEQAKNSPLGLKEDWKGKVENAFASGLVRVPPQATRFVLASQFDFECKEPLWLAAVMSLDEDIALGPLAKARGGTLDEIEGLPALSLPNDTYLVQLGSKVLGAMAPGNRQAVVRWIREARATSSPPLSPYLRKAASYSDKAGSEIIMAMDLDGVLSFERAAKYVKTLQKGLDEWQAKEAKPATAADLARIFSAIQGIRIGVRIGEEQSSKIAVDFRTDPSPISAFAKPLLLQILADQGGMIDDFRSWNAQTTGDEISLAGTLSINGRRRLLSVIDSPVQESVVAQEPSVSPGDQPAIEAKKSRDYFRAIVGMADDLKDDMKNAKNLASSQLYFDKYARRIERMPILGVDEELLKYSAFVSNALRQAASAVKTMGIQSGARQAQITGGGDYGSAYRYGPYGGYGGYSPGQEIKDVGAERRVVRAEETAVMATDIQTLRQDIIAATTDMRRKMTQKYQIEF